MSEEIAWALVPIIFGIAVVIYCIGYEVGKNNALRWKTGIRKSKP